MEEKDVLVEVRGFADAPAVDRLTLGKLKIVIEANPHLTSARANRDYLTIGLEIASSFPQLTCREHFTDNEGHNYHADTIPRATIRDAMNLKA